MLVSKGRESVFVIVAMHLLVALIISVILASPLVSNQQVEADLTDSRHREDQSNDDELASRWEYEPRVWSPDGAEEEEDFDGALEDFTASSLSQVTGKELFRRQSNFLNPNIKLKQASGEREQKCTQFRVDIRDAVVCDKKRCDKFDFEWPTYSNQIALIETTKHGMRFHRADFAMSSALKKLGSPTDGKIQLGDLLDLFKPKPNQSSITTQPPATTTAAPATSSVPTRDAQEPDQLADTNTTQLVATYRIDTKRVKQKMIGFGGALSDSSCRNIKSLSPEMSRSLMEDYFGDRGLKYNIVRLTMGSSDFSTTTYTNNDELEQGNSTSSRLLNDELGDVEMKNFRLTEEDYEYKLPVARQAIAISKQRLKFFSSLWSPPIWMKNNSHIVHGYLKGDIYGPYYRALAEYIVKWLESYKRHGIDFWATTGLNEPVTGVKEFIHHNSLGITRDDYVTFFKLYLGPMLRQRGFANVKLIMLDDNKGYLPNYVPAMLDDQEASRYVDGIGIHWYMNDEFENMDFLAKRYPNKFIISTEACNGYLPFQVHVLPGNWDRGVAYMLDAIKTIQKNSAGWVDWNMALDLAGGPTWAKNNLDAAIIVNAKRDEYYKNPMFYALGHFSKFIDPDSVRLDYRIANAKYDYPLEAVAFMTPKNYIVIVALNANRNSIPFKLIVDRKLIRVMNLRAESFNTIVFKWDKGRTQP